MGASRKKGTWKEKNRVSGEGGEIHEPGARPPAPALAARPPARTGRQRSTGAARWDPVVTHGNPLRTFYPDVIDTMVLPGYYRGSRGVGAPAHSIVRAGSCP